MTTALALILLASSGAAADLRVHRDIAYTDAVDRQRTLDVYAPADGQDQPILIWVHGGGWRQGDKSGVQCKPQAFVDHGYVFISLNYRFVPQVTVKEMTGDVAKAVRWVHDHARSTGAPLTRSSSPGTPPEHTSRRMVSTDGSHLQAEGLSLSTIKGCIPVDTAAYDVPKKVQGVGPLLSSRNVEVFGSDEAGQKALSPISHIARDKWIPPFLILHVADRPDSRSQSEAFAKALRDAGVEANVLPATGKTHATINSDLGLPDDKPTRSVFEFLDELNKRS